MLPCSNHIAVLAEVQETVVLFGIPLSLLAFESIDQWGQASQYWHR